MWLFVAKPILEITWKIPLPSQLQHHWHFRPDNSLLCGCCPVPCSLFCSSPGLYPLDARSPHHPKVWPPKMSLDSAETPKGQNCPHGGLCSGGLIQRQPRCLNPQRSIPTECSSTLCLKSSRQLRGSWQSPFFLWAEISLPERPLGPCGIPAHSIQKPSTCLKTALSSYRFYSALRPHDASLESSKLIIQAGGGLCGIISSVLSTTPSKCFTCLVLWCLRCAAGTSVIGESQTENEVGTFLEKLTHTAFWIIFTCFWENRKIGNNNHTTCTCRHTSARWDYHRNLEFPASLYPAWLTWPLCQPDTVLHHSDDRYHLPLHAITAIFRAACTVLSPGLFLSYPCSKSCPC